MNRLIFIVVVLFVSISLLVWRIRKNIENFEQISPSLVENGCYDYLSSVDKHFLYMNILPETSDIDRELIARNRLDVISNFSAMRTQTDGVLDTDYAYLDACVLDKNIAKKLYGVTSNCVITGEILTSNVIDQFGTLSSGNVSVAAKSFASYSSNGIFSVPINGNNVTEGCIFDFSDSNYSVNTFLSNLDTLYAMKEYKELAKGKFCRSK